MNIMASSASSPFLQGFCMVVVPITITAYFTGTWKEIHYELVLWTGTVILAS